jgi:uncharacterized alkaline shock family protein YloU
MSNPSNSNEESTIPSVTEDSNTLGEIRINHSVVSSIVRLATLEVRGVCAVGGSFVDGIADIFSKKGDERGVRVDEDEVGDYKIEIRVILRFGLELAAVASEIQQRVAEQIEIMTSKSVARVNVVIDGVRTEAQEKQDQNNQQQNWEAQPHTD